MVGHPDLRSIHLILISGYIFFLPLDFHFSSLIFIAVLTISIARIQSVKFAYLRSTIFFICLFLLYLISSLYNGESNKTIESNLLFLLVPFVFSSLELDIDEKRRIFKTYVIGCVLGIFVCYLFPFLYYFSFDSLSFTPIYFEHQEIANPKYNWLNYFISNQFTRAILNRAYFSLYISFAFFVVLILKLFTPAIRYTILLLFLLSILQSFSITGIIGFYALLIGYIFYNMKNRNLRLGVIGLIVLIGILIFQIERFQIFVGEMIQFVKTGNLSKSAFGYRYTIWSVSMEAIREKLFFGYGIEAAQEMINQGLLRELNWNLIWLKYKSIFNAHNQYLQILIEIGLLGFGVFLAIFASFIKSIMKHSSEFRQLGIVFISLFLLQCTSESMFGRYWGFGFFIFFYCVFLNRKVETK